MNLQTYAAALDYMYHRLPMYSNVGAVALKPGLANIIALCEAIGNPHLQLKCIHVAGSNGKGSVSHMLAGTLQHAGYKVGLYTSPHLVDLRERFRIDGALVPESYVIDFLNQYHGIIEAIKPSYFEINVAMAFDFFNREKVDYVVVETGLGGRLDSTNIITPLLSVITNISLEHTAILGDTLDKIAFEKAGIIKYQIPVVIGESHSITDPVFLAKSNETNSPIVFADQLYKVEKIAADLHQQSFRLMEQDGQLQKEVITDLLGDYQSKNIVTAYAAVNELIRQQIISDDQPFIEALSQVKSLTGLRGRWEVLQHDPLIIIDVAHNPAGMEYFKNQTAKLSHQGKVHVVLGCASDKDVTTVLKNLPQDISLVLTQASVARAMDINQLSTIATNNGWQYKAYETVPVALEHTLNELSKDDILIITGSFFIVADALNYLKL